MTTSSLKKSLQKSIDSIEDRDFLQAVLTIISDKLKEQEYSLTPAQIAILEEREKKHLTGKSRSYKLGELKKALAARK